MVGKNLEHIRRLPWMMLCLAPLALLGLTACAGTPPRVNLATVEALSPSPSPTTTHTPTSEPTPTFTPTPTPWPKVSGPVEITLDPGPEESDETALCVKTLVSEIKVFCLTLADVARNHYHPAEYHDGVLYVLKDVTDDERPGAAQTEELWAYTGPNEGTKLCEDPGLGSYRAAPDNRYVAITGGPPRVSLRFLDPEGKTVRTFTAEELVIADPKVRDSREPHLGLEAWVDGGSALWIRDHAGPSPQAFVTIDVESWTITQYDVSDLTIPVEYALNPDTGQIVYSDCPAIYDAPAAEAFAESDQEVTLSVYDLDAGTGQDLATVEARRLNRESIASSRCFNPEWVDDRTVAYDNPGGEGRITVTVQETYDFGGIPTDVTAWDTYSLPHLDVTVPVPPTWEITERQAESSGPLLYSASFQPPLWETPAECGYQCPAIGAAVYHNTVNGTSAPEIISTWLEQYATSEPFGADVNDAVQFFGVEKIEETTLGGRPALSFHHDVMGIRVYTTLTLVDESVVSLSKTHVGQFEFEPVYTLMQTHMAFQ